jgi:putative ABC transport system permease protein
VTYFISFMLGIVLAAGIALLPFFILLVVGEFALNRFPFGRSARFLLIMLKSLRRNLLRTTLTYLATFVLVVVVTFIWSVLYYLDTMTTEQSRDVKLIVSEKWQANSQMPFAYASRLADGAADPTRSHDVQPQDSMTWQFYIGTLDPTKKTRENLVFFIALEPAKMPTMLREIFDTIGGEEAKHRHGGPDLLERVREAARAMEHNKRYILVGRERLKALNKQVGERFTVSGMNYSGIDLEFEILGLLPEGRYDMLAVMNRDYLNDSIDAYPRTHGGQAHPLAGKNLNLVWLKVPDIPSFNQVAAQIDASPFFNTPAVKCETLSSGVVTALDGYRDLIWGMRWLLSPAILATMTLILANAISISVRERRTEMAVLKVLGYRPAQILLLVLGEAMLIGAGSGLLSAGMTYFGIDELLSRYTFVGIYVPEQALWWGPLVGAVTALAGSALPAWSGCSVKVSEVFSRTA